MAAILSAPFPSTDSVVDGISFHVRRTSTWTRRAFVCLWEWSTEGKRGEHCRFWAVARPDTNLHRAPNEERCSTTLTSNGETWYWHYSSTDLSFCCYHEHCTGCGTEPLLFSVTKTAITCSSELIGPRCLTSPVPIRLGDFMILSRQSKNIYKLTQHCLISFLFHPLW